MTEEQKPDDEPEVNPLLADAEERAKNGVQLDRADLGVYSDRVPRLPESLRG
jgi:hypothetical protein